MKWKIAATALLLLVSSANAQMNSFFPGPGTVHSTGGGGGYTGPGDVVTNALVWYGLRCYNTAYTGNVADIWDSSTGSTTETLLTCSAGGTINETIHSLATTCASGCRVKTLYDQAGTACSSGTVACDITQATNASRPTFTQNCIGSLPCMTFAASQQLQGTVPGLPSTALPATISSATRQTSSLAGAYFCLTGGTGLEGYYTTAPAVRVYNGTNQTVSTVNNTWYANQSVVNGVSSVIYLNGSSNSIGDPGGTAILAQTIIGNDNFGQLMTGNIVEVGLWASAFNGTQQSNMNSNQRTYWGF